MKAEIIEKKENKIFEREEIKAILKHVGAPTPSLASVQGFMAKLLGTEPKHIEVASVKSLKGADEAEAFIIFWKNKEVEDLTKPKEEPKSEEKKSNGDKNAS